MTHQKYKKYSLFDFFSFQKNRKFTFTEKKDSKKEGEERMNLERAHFTQEINKLKLELSLKDDALK